MEPMRKNRDRLIPCLLLALVSLLALASCSKDDDDIPTPVIEYLVTYRLNVVSEVEVNEITYLDSLGQTKVIAGDRNFNLTFRAVSGDRLSLGANGIITLGFASVNIEAFAPGKPVEVAVDEQGHPGPDPLAFDLEAELVLQ